MLNVCVSKIKLGPAEVDLLPCLKCASNAYLRSEGQRIGLCAHGEDLVGVGWKIQRIDRRWAACPVIFGTLQVVARWD